MRKAAATRQIIESGKVRKGGVEGTARLGFAPGAIASDIAGW
jgi:hypothetical protein